MNSRLYFILLLHLVLCILYFGMFLLFHGRFRIQETFIRFVIILIVPFGGVFTFLLCDLVYRIINRSKPDLSDVLPPESDFKFVRSIDKQKDINTIPIEEEIIVGDNISKRAYLLNVLKSDYKKHIKQLSVAIDDPDTETSHYAAAAMIEIRKKITAALQQTEALYKNNPKDQDVLLAYSNALREYIRSEIADEETIFEHKLALIKVLEDQIGRIEEMDVNPQIEEYNELVSLLIEINDLNKATLYNQKFMQSYPDREEPYLQAIKIYYYSGDMGRFSAMIDVVKKSGVQLSSKGLGLIRFWGGAK